MDSCIKCDHLNYVKLTRLSGKPALLVAPLTYVGRRHRHYEWPALNKNEAAEQQYDDARLSENCRTGSNDRV